MQPESRRPHRPVRVCTPRVAPSSPFRAAFAPPIGGLTMPLQALESMEPRRLLSSLMTVSSHDEGGHGNEHERGRRDAQDVFAQTNLVTDGGPGSEPAPN